MKPWACKAPADSAVASVHSWLVLGLQRRSQGFASPAERGRPNNDATLGKRDEEDGAYGHHLSADQH